jgi:hypothetical protein
MTVLGRLRTVYCGKRQNEPSICALAGDKFWTDYMLTLKARKISGSEGFLNLFRIAKNGDRIWRNIGGLKSIKNVGTFWEKRKFCKFFYLFPYKYLRIFAVLKTPKFSHQSRRFVLLTRGRYYFKRRPNRRTTNNNLSLTT